MRLSPSLARVVMWKRIAGYGIHAFVAYLGNTLLTQGPPILVGHYQPVAFSSAGATLCHRGCCNTSSNWSPGSAT